MSNENPKPHPTSVQVPVEDFIRDPGGSFAAATEPKIIALKDFIADPSKAFDLALTKEVIVSDEDDKTRAISLRPVFQLKTRP